ncbi:MAG: S8 family serine peptidase [Saprospiraceae bacterium]
MANAIRQPMGINGSRAAACLDWLSVAVVWMLSAAALAAQPRLSKYWVEFSDKNGTPYCTCRPAEFLSARALDRRAREGIAVDESDLPPTPRYLDSLRSCGARIHNVSRWLNAAAVIADSATASALKRFPFVKKVAYLGPDLRIKNPPNRPPKQRRYLSEVPRLNRGRYMAMGHAQAQNNQLGLIPLYEAGFRGRGIWIAVLDGGFDNADALNFFDSLDIGHRLIEGWDFVERDGGVFESSSHGTAVLSVMGGNLPGYFVGSAPDATYFLLKTEDVGGEYPIEEANWVAGAEWADSIGADIINASLGYTHFNDTSLNHSYVTLDGRTAIASRGAAIAARKGMLVFNSAGNSGSEPWRHIGVPADAPGLIAVGALTGSGRRARFSSVGPSADGRIKPDLMAPGDGIAVSGYSGFSKGTSSGTSLASPMLAGAVASLWGAYPDRPAREIIAAVYRSADRFARPNNLYGYGTPNMTQAWLELGAYASGQTLNNARSGGLFAHRPDANELSLLLLPDAGRIPIDGSEFEIALYDLLGRRHEARIVKFGGGELLNLSLRLPEALPPGAYRLALQTSEGSIFFFTLLFS